MKKVIKKCPHCHKEYYEVYETYGGVDENRTTYIICPYCKEIVAKDIRLSKCEELWAIKLEEAMEDILE